ncbi:MAG: 50S ribosomal protein L7Ae [Candidatus Aenigmarchaeota archaeon]|nr:50S ribosomal protein L7Ae [Candidatus Aenigmarchaeota archaeon]MCK5322076.1 50S ribosomal protein L7Ae [Candidatus Aenigmarchaeota archaeon]
MTKKYVTFEMPKDLADEVYNTLEVVSKSGKIRKGVNEVTKALERNITKLVVISEDIEPEEIVMHLPLLAKEKKVAIAFVPTKQELGAAIGISVSCGAVAVVEEGKAEKDIASIVSKVNTLNK